MRKIEWYRRSRGRGGGLRFNDQNAAALRHSGRGVLVLSIRKRQSEELSMCWMAELASRGAAVLVFSPAHVRQSYKRVPAEGMHELVYSLHQRIALLPFTFPLSHLIASRPTLVPLTILYQTVVGIQKIYTCTCRGKRYFAIPCRIVTSEPGIFYFSWQAINAGIG